MTPERWQQIEALLDRALDLPADERAAFLDQACPGDPDLRREVDDLLAAEAHAPAFLDQDAAAFAAPALDGLPGATTPSLEGRRIGPYRLLHELGRGGMGVVYLAEREDVGKKVALKLVRGGVLDPLARRRFLRERRVLARLDHPHIARLYDAGMAETDAPVAETPYFVMEYVEGQPIDRYCDAEQLSIEARLRLFETVCWAVQHAHQHFVVHRDLKPSNILVTDDGRVKLLDFGIAKLLAEAEDEEVETLTGPGRQMLTPAYAAPEQVQGEAVTAATDVYALGVVLYELLTGHCPYDTSGSSLEAAQAVLNQDPKRPSTAVTTSEDTAPLAQARGTTSERLGRRLRGDLDMVCLKALQKEPSRRYASAEAFVEDIRRHLAGLPVVARPDTAAYRVKKFVRRHRLGVAAAAAFAVLVLGFAVAMALQQRATARERDRAQAEAEKAGAVTDFMLGLFEANEPEAAPTDTITARTLLARGMARAREMEGQPEVQAEMLMTIGRAYRVLGRSDQAEPLLREALAIQQRLPHGEPEVVAESLHELGEVLHNRGDYAGADSFHHAALALRRTRFGERHPDVASSLTELGRTAWYQGNLGAADSLTRLALGLSRELVGEEDRLTILIMSDLANILSEKGDFPAAESLQRAVLPLRRRVFGERHVSVADDLNLMGVLRVRQADFEAADSFFHAALALYRDLLGESHSNIATLVGNLGVVKRNAGDYEAAERYMREAVALQQRINGDRHPFVAIAMSNLGRLLALKGQYASSLALHRQALALRREVLGAEHPAVASSLSYIADVLSRQGRHVEAERLYRDALAIRRTALGAEHPSVAAIMSDLATTLRKQRALAAAESLYHQVSAIHQKIYGPEHFTAGSDRMNLAMLRSDQGDHEAAEDQFRQALDVLRSALPEGHPRIAEALDAFGVLLTRKGTYAEAEQALDETLRLRRVALGDDHPDTRETMEHLATLYDAWNRPEQAAAYRALLANNE